MIKNTKTQHGFSAVEGLLILIIIGIIGGTGWYVWHANKNANNSYNDVTNSTAIPTKQKNAKNVNPAAGTIAPSSKTVSSSAVVSPKYKTSAWTKADLTFESRSRVTFAVPDGWHVLNVAWDGSISNLIVLRETSTFKPGHRALVDKSRGGWDGWSRFNASVNPNGKYKGYNYKCQESYTYDSKNTFKTKEFTGTKYVKNVTKDESGGMGARTKGKYYTYYFPYKEGTQNLCLSFSYVQFPGDQDQHAVVESSIISAARFQ